MTHLYRHFDKNGTLLYIGISISAIYRFGVHTELCSDWIEKTTRIEIERFLIRQDALEAEKKAIINERPLYNYAHNKNVVPRRIYKPPLTGSYKRLLDKFRARDVKMIMAYLSTPLKPACEIYRKHKISRSRFYWVLKKHGIKPRTP